MSDRSKAVLEAALALSAEERSDLAHELLDSLDAGDGEPLFATPEIEAAWVEEIQRRREEALRDPSVVMTWDEARLLIFRPIDG